MHSYRHILCATDFSAASDLACARAAALSECFGAQLTLLHVVENFPERRSNQVIAPEDADPQQYRDDEARRRLREQAERVGVEPTHQQVTFTTESAWHAIADYAQTHQVDLVVLAEHEQRGLKGLLPTAIEHLPQTQVCDVLIVPMRRGVG